MFAVHEDVLLKDTCWLGRMWKRVAEISLIVPKQKLEFVPVTKLDKTHFAWREQGKNFFRLGFFFPHRASPLHSDLRLSRSRHSSERSRRFGR